ncbi:hypothetical protein IQ264_06245 [Phormidium sp. LEGE 05292]|uniref:hypothetical protein n=1 Tax=[Phormidium] sp. LEGE 05292 TaxID=767427 RepID=UPI001881D6C3|nr:hypothetical protein [Phormidium sp. LEGE 05292]MBE9225035.1 hypothetical protein [Phormidium sp. LEGE 05292]
MLHHSSLNKSLATILFLGLAITPVYAHNVQVAADVGGTLHIEPNDNPKAGESTQIWIALTRQGGKLIPLKDCNCQMAVYTKPRLKGSLPLLKPALKPISNSQYQGIPGADLVFPKVGNYEIEISGTPKANANFKPFKLTFPVTVAAGRTAAAPTASPKAINSPSQNLQRNTLQTNKNAELNSQTKPRINPALPLIITGASLTGVGVLGAVLQKKK